MNNTKAEALVDQIKELPDMPFVAVRLNKLLMNPNVDVSQLAETIAMDASLTTKVLRLCNSSAYALPRKIASVKEAVPVLGLNTLKQIVFTVVSQSVFSRPFQGYALGKGELWENALVCANTAQVIAKYLNFRNADVIYTAALLRDIGKLAMETLIMQNPDQFDHVLSGFINKSFEQVEMDVFGVSHTEVGALLAKEWYLPEQLVATIEYHHQPSQAQNDVDDETMKIISVVHLADCFTAMMGVGVGADGLMYSLDNEAVEALNLEPSELPELFSLALDQAGVVEETLEALEGSAGGVA